LTPVVAVDCEMVGVGADGVRSSLARVCVVNSAGNVLLDEHVAQRERVVDYRTRFSGIRPSDLVGAPSLEEVQRKVADMFKGRVVVGHAITNDLTALLLSHPRKSIRDTARFPPLMRATAPGRRPKPRALRQLALEHLGLTIQEGEHSPVDDARAALYLYQKHRKVGNPNKHPEP
ncbi:Exonuclease, partial [Coccomyxa subellipsoidea C-169]